MLTTAGADVPGELRGKVLSGLGWKAISQVSLQVARLAVSVTLARLLLPREFGLAGMVLVFSGMAALFTDLALGAALVQRKEITEEDISTVFWTTVAVGAVMTGVAVAVAKPLADFYGEPRVTALFSGAAVAFLINAVSATQASLLTRAMDFRSLEVRQIGATVVAGVVAVIAAVLGAGPWTLIVQSLVSGAVSGVLLWRFSSWKPQFVFSTASLRDLGPFGMRIFGSRFFAYANSNADNLLIGRFLGSAALGVYSIAYNLMLAPAFRIVAPIQAVLFPAFARLQNDRRRMRETWLGGNAVLAAIMIPSFLGLAAVAPDFVPTVLGHRWHAAVPVLQFLSIAGVGQSLQSLNYSVLQASGSGKQLLRYSMLSALITIGAFVLGLQWGVVGVAACYAASRFILLVPFTLVTGRVVGIGLWTFFRSVHKILEVSAVMAALVFGVRVGLSSIGAPGLMRLVLEIAIGAVSYLYLLPRRDPVLIADVLRLAGRPRPGWLPSPRPHGRWKLGRGTTAPQSAQLIEIDRRLLEATEQIAALKRERRELLDASREKHAPVEERVAARERFRRTTELLRQRATQAARLETELAELHPRSDRVSL
jgi:O-antigen/teichoic acid export membrane protein